VAANKSYHPPKRSPGHEDSAPEIIEIRPQLGPQELFLSSPADIVIYGGAAGGGKTMGLVMEASRNINVPGYAAIMFRRLSTEITGGGSMWEESTKIYPALGGESREGRLDWSFKTGHSSPRALIEFDHLQHEKDKLNHQGKQYAFIGVDELTHFTESQFWYLLSRNRSTCGVRPYMRCTCNPDPDSFVRKLIDWWIDKDGFAIMDRSGVIRYFVRDGDELCWGDSPDELRQRYPHLMTEQEPLSFTFIAASLADNPILEQKDPGYRSKLMMLQRVDRERLLKGNWNVRPTAGSYFKRHYFKKVAMPHPSDIVIQVRGWDKAATEPSTANPDPDYSASVRMCRLRTGRLVIMHANWARKNPHGVEEFILDTMEQDGTDCQVAMWQDPAQAGKSEIEHFGRLVTVGDPIRGRRGGYIFTSERANKDKETFAKPVSSAAEYGNIDIVEAPWNDDFFNFLEGFPGGGHDDPVDALSLAFLKCATSDLAWLEGMVQGLAARLG
jgi:predicted phage terminase large subunit-like protein